MKGRDRCIYAYTESEIESEVKQKERGEEAIDNFLEKICESMS